MSSVHLLWIFVPHNFRYMCYIIQTNNTSFVLYPPHLSVRFQLSSNNQHGDLNSFPDQNQGSYRDTMAEIFLSELPELI